VMPPTVKASQVFGIALYSAKAIIGGRGKDVISLVKDNFLK